MRPQACARSRMGQTCFNLRREASPHATESGDHNGVSLNIVSISDEKPAPMRQGLMKVFVDPFFCFNLRREASPHATSEVKRLYHSMPLFQSQTRSQPPCDKPEPNTGNREKEFQSQTRSQPPCDKVTVTVKARQNSVSISDEKPAPMRRLIWHSNPSHLQPFQSQTRSQPPCDQLFQR